MNEQISDSRVYSWAHFLLPSCVVQLQSVDFALSSYIYFDVFYCSLGSLFFLMRGRERTGVDSEKKGGREKMGEEEEGDTLLRIDYIRKRIHFQ